MDKKKEQTENQKPLVPLAAAAPELDFEIRAGTPVSVFGVSAGERMHIAAAIDRFPVYITADYVAARAVTETLNQLSDDFLLLPARADVLRFVAARESTAARERALCFGGILTGSCRGIVTTMEAVLQIFPSKTRWQEAAFVLRKGAALGRDKFKAALIHAGFSRVDLVEGHGTFSLRGDIAEIFPITSDTAYRVEFWDETVEKIKAVDPLTRLGKEEIDAITVFPACEAVTHPSEGLAALENINRDLSGKLPPDAEVRRERMRSAICPKLATGASDASLEFVLPYLEHSTVFEWLPTDATLIFDETKALLDIAQSTEKEHLSRLKSLIQSGEAFPRGADQLLSFDRFVTGATNYRLLSFARITTSNFFFQPRHLFHFQSVPITRYNHNFAELTADLRIWQSRGYRILLCTRDADGDRAAQEELSKRGIAVQAAVSAEEFCEKDDGVFSLPVPLSKGFTYHDSRLIVIGSGELFFHKARSVARTGGRAAFIQPKPGDYVVHYVHGIGRCLGEKRLTTSLGTKDYIEVEYRDGDRLFVPVDQMDLLSCYSGEMPRLSKMGGGEFSKAKARVKARIDKLAVDLLSLYSARHEARGHTYTIDKTLMNEFVARFPYESTSDQLTAFQEIEADLSSGKVMDRLLIGDVGYGKTEVALRAAFACIAEGKQVAFLAPTTILSEQHFGTVQQRFADFGVRVAVINRFCNAAKQKAILGKLEKGDLDFICGTHRLLSKDVRFHDLGLLILDEEQRFGVGDKEKIKEMKTTVNVLTMTATPIPRTLHMSMTGIRDISTLSNPPADRLPVQTMVTEYSESLVRDAVAREMNRGGQAFIVYNRVESIFHFAAKLEELLPQARIIVCHGQMSETELEANIKRVYDGDADVLVSTTIIENGIDLGNANTMIVVHADRLGLSQLYQLRGRVGRTNRLAYAYFTFEAGKILSEDAAKRLQSLSDFTELGSGFKIAQRDLEIRGAGSVLGAEQHGHIENIGYDLYCKMLGQAVRAAQGKKTTPIEERECEVVMDVDAYISDDYVPDAESRMNIYARIAAIKTLNDRDRFLAELKDVYGTPPKEATNLVTVGLFKGYGERLGAEQIRVTKASAVITLTHIYKWTAQILSDKPQGVTLKAAAHPQIIFTPAKEPLYERVFRFLTEALSAKSKIANS